MYIYGRRATTKYAEVTFHEYFMVTFGQGERKIAKIFNEIFSMAEGSVGNLAKGCICQKRNPQREKLM